ncbi:MAG TPA: hypothetical protein DHU55_01505, partial [Blastocatellia bacterium]|nr:hypothetical protein [Blastocatellia bacterium]
MNRTRFTLVVALIGLLGLLSYSYLTRTVQAQSDRALQGAGGPEIIPHRINERGADSFALTTGGTTATSPILYHGGPLINTPTVYVIWYGNWN